MARRQRRLDGIEGVRQRARDFVLVEVGGAGEAVVLALNGLLIYNVVPPVVSRAPSEPMKSSRATWRSPRSVTLYVDSV